MRSAPSKFEPLDGGAAAQGAGSRLATSLTLAAMSLGYGVVQLDVTIVNTALDAIGKSLGGGVAELQWVVSAYTIAFAAFILTAGALGDRIGAKRIFMAGFALFTAASLACAMSPNAAILIAARCVQGLAAAILVPNSLALLNHAYADDKARGRAVGGLGGRREPGAHCRSVRRRRADHAGRLALDLPGQPADRSRRLVADLALRRARPRGRRSARSICPASSPRSRRSAAWPARSSKAARWLEESARDRRFRAFALRVLFVWRESRAAQPMLPLSLFRIGCLR